jgi:hypothetical protein
MISVQARGSWFAACGALLACSLLGCGEAEEAPRVSVALVSDASGMGPTRTDLGYEVELLDAAVAIEDVLFATAGEAHEGSLLRRMSDWLVPVAVAHPGHFQNGDITGELRGRFVVRWNPDAAQTLGRATLLAGKYRSANFTFAEATEADGLTAEDALLGHTASLRGRATRGGSSLEFSVVVDSPAGRDLIGAPFNVDVQRSRPLALAFRLLLADPAEADTMFDGVDFASLPASGGVLVIGPTNTEPGLVDAYNRIRRALQSHDHFEVRGRGAT